jgi:hypothetical protein
MAGASTFPRLARRLSVLVAGAALGAVTFVAPLGAAGQPSINLDQCRNGSASSPANCLNLGGASGWANGNAGSSQAHYVEGQSAPYRAVMENLPTGTPITLVLGYDVKHSDAHAIDFLTHYNRLEPHGGFGHPAEQVNPIDGITGLSSTVGTFPVPAPSTVGSPVAGQPATAFNALPSGERVMTLFGGTISAMTYVSQGSLTAAQSETQMSVTFTVDSPTAVLAWGGHIATAGDWGAGNSATNVSGAPYHMRLGSWTLNNLGNTDRSLSAGAVFVTNPDPVAQLAVTKVVNNGDGGTRAVGDFSLFVGSTAVTSGALNSLTPGTYTVSEGPHAGYVSTIGGDCAPNGTITLVAGQAAECIITNDDIPNAPAPAQLTVTKIVVNDNGGTRQVSDFALFVGSTHVTSGAVNSLDAGSYTVSEGDHAGYVSTIGGACAANGTITLVAGQVAQCTITNNDVAPVTTNPAPNTDIESGTDTRGSSPTIPAVTPQTPGTATSGVGAELPRTGAGLREEALLGLILLAAGLFGRALGHRRTRPSV